MSDSYFSLLKRDIQEEKETHIASLLRGTPSRDDDQRLRGIVYGLDLAQGLVTEIERRAARDESPE